MYFLYSKHDYSQLSVIDVTFFYLFTEKKYGRINATSPATYCMFPSAPAACGPRGMVVATHTAFIVSKLNLWEEAGTNLCCAGNGPRQQVV